MILTDKLREADQRLDIIVHDVAKIRALLNPEAVEVSPALDLIAKERERQIHQEGWSLEHDDTHRYGDLAVHAAELAVEGTDAYIKDAARDFDEWGLVAKHKHDRVRCLVIAGALLVAELEREWRRIAALKRVEEGS